MAKWMFQMQFNLAPWASDFLVVNKLRNNYRFYVILILILILIRNPMKRRNQILLLARRYKQRRKAAQRGFVTTLQRIGHLRWRWPSLQVHPCSSLSGLLIRSPQKRFRNCNQSSLLLSVSPNQFSGRPNTAFNSHSTYLGMLRWRKLWHHRYVMQILV